jgi:hypothetical protein
LTCLGYRRARDPVCVRTAVEHREPRSVRAIQERAVGDRIGVPVAGAPSGDLFGAPDSGKSFWIIAVDIQTVRDGKIAQTYRSPTPITWRTGSPRSVSSTPNEGARTGPPVRFDYFLREKHGLCGSPVADLGASVRSNRPTRRSCWDPIA